MLGKHLQILILTPFVQRHMERQTTLPQVIPRIDSGGYGAEWDFRKANVMSTGGTGKEMDTGPYQTAGPYHACYLGHDRRYLEEMFKGSDRCYEVKTVVSERKGGDIAAHKCLPGGR